MKNLIACILFSIIGIQVYGQHTLKIAANSNLRISNATSIILHNTQFINNGTFDAATGTVIIKGTASDNLSAVGGSSNTVFYNLKIDKTSNGSQLGQSIQIDNNLDMTNGNLDLNGQVLTLGTTNGQIVNESSNSYLHGSNGYVQKTTDLNTPANVNPGNIGATITSTANLGSTIIQRGHAPQSIDGSNSIQRYYNIKPTNNDPLNATLRLNYLDHELNSISEMDLEPFRNNGSSWEYYDVSSADGTANYVETSGIHKLDTLTLAKGHLKLMSKIMLEGPFAGGLMNDQLRSKGLIPTTEPFTALGFSQVGGGGETVNPTVFNTTGNDAIVDWVFLELRDKTNPATVLRTRAALLQKDGDIVDLNGIAPASFPVIGADDYFIAVKHRNHLAIRTPAAMNLSLMANSYDFTSAFSQAYGLNPMSEVSTGVWALWGGNTTGDGIVRATGPAFVNDYTRLLSYLGVPTGFIRDVYTREDINMDGDVRASGPPFINDYSKLLNILGTPTNFILQRL